MTLHRPTIIDHRIPRIGLHPESPPVLLIMEIPNRAGGQVFGLAQPVVRRRVTRWEHVETRTEVRPRPRHRGGAMGGLEEASNNREATVGSEEAMRVKDPQEQRGQEAQARQHQVLPDTRAQDLDQQGDVEAFDDSINEQQNDNSDLSSIDSSSTYTQSSDSSSDCFSDSFSHSSLCASPSASPNSEPVSSLPAPHCLASRSCYICSPGSMPSTYQRSTYESSICRGSSYTRGSTVLHEDSTLSEPTSS
jgi:hypothetical protein